MKTADKVLLHDKAAFRTVEPPCPYVGSCGGCTLQDLEYADQLTLKRQRLLRTLGTLDPSLTLELVPVEDPWRYRNKAELTFSALGPAADSLVLGYHAARSFWRIVDLDDCLLLPEAVSRLIADIRELAQRTGQPAYNPRTHQGFFRYLVIRHSRSRDKLLICLMTTRGERSLIESFADELLRKHPAISSVYWGIATNVADVAMPEELFLIRGETYLEDQVGALTIRLHPLNFLQPNSAQAERMYEQVRRWVSASGQGVAWDVYCGIGLIAFYLSSGFRTIYAIDSEARNLELARVNAQANGITNVQFQLGRAEDVFLNKRFWLGEAQPDVVVVDPPRSGLHPRVISTVLAARPKQLICLSCNAQTLVRDSRLLMNSFPRYRLRDLVAFDLFPHTPHVEVLALFER
ncbi:MAG TPA: 23S rRNA (uracil(1939)-C(5))-methyltransferase RlmD [Candidatus Omnitrophica bacterium]|nr:MAG: 23S rRNA (uracil-5-)-methyltransferase RumA [Omnitrophica WOR_2 bacterium GWA2_63_20]OGX35579.1 MAG: 23S rRNA (uracil-5-)-methyltransferase RumA [Omnitrophica WOR_2 bacterium RIFCSPHIGHO2_02_FULL_63_39]OGX46290.1 MAG: 23S rRNA (uracil-5-)-methyltransferase RumA [Omnitrophica WOR_2 bacterium RIFCSPLOWO2_02_FULL_63_16]OGX47068.1 MAG: 23S rRNA (uracil-5-)-methyltransferase RumA [Omnitrophica WOR_2 bacterium RIFCSPLOWO2_12_FULL_63_16]HBH97424.1 23S rRNA (uracil(1939)-C(5))-methyltransferase